MSASARRRSASVYWADRRVAAALAAGSYSLPGGRATGPIDPAATTGLAVMITGVGGPLTAAAAAAAAEVGGTKRDGAGADGAAAGGRARGSRVDGGAAGAVLVMPSQRDDGDELFESITST